LNGWTESGGPEYFSSKRRALSSGPQNIKWRFLENISNGFELISIIVGNNIPK
jgi:hypothetical protein